MEAGPRHRPLPLGVTRLRDKPTQLALRRLSARLLRNHGVFIRKPCPSLGSALVLVAQHGNLWDHPHGKDFLPADVCDTSSVYHHRTQDNVCIVCLPLFVSQKFSMQIKGIYVIIQNYQIFFAKSLDLRSIFKLVKGFLANVLIIITLVALLHFSPKLLKICY